MKFAVDLLDWRILFELVDLFMLYSDFYLFSFGLYLRL